MEKYLDMYTVCEYREQDELMKNLAVLVAGELEAVLSQKDRATLALPGGSTPKPFFKKLSHSDINWEKVIVIPTDERFVPETDPLSNFSFIKNNLKKNYARKLKIVNFFKPEYSLEKLASIMSKDLKVVLPIDICVLGMGLDMHTASIFPGLDKLSDALDLNTSKILVPISSPGINESRLTLTAKVLREAQKTHILLTGSEKKEALAFALKSKDNWNVAPVRSVIFGQSDVKIHFAN